MKYSNEIDKVSYSLGVSIATNLLSSGVENMNLEAFTDALTSVFTGKMPEITPDEIEKILQNYFMKLQQKKGAIAKDAGKKFLENNKKKEGVVTLPSGLQYKILKEGKGPKPAASDVVLCHYEGRLINGFVFDSSIERNEPAKFPVNGVIAGWVEALQLMPVGSKWQLYIPSELAYGTQGAGKAIGPNETLIFDVELLEIL